MAMEFPIAKILVTIESIQMETVHLIASIHVMTALIVTVMVHLIAPTHVTIESIQMEMVFQIVKMTVMIQ